MTPARELCLAITTTQAPNLTRPKAGKRLTLTEVGPSGLAQPNPDIPIRGPHSKGAFEAVSVDHAHLLSRKPDPALEGSAPDAGSVKGETMFPRLCRLVQE